MRYGTEYAEAFDWKSVEHIPRKDRQRLKKAIEEKLSIAPEIFGKPLHSPLTGFRRLRVGNYRIIFIINKKTVVIVRIAHRASVYEE